jgi:hypothetical protein
MPGRIPADSAPLPEPRCAREIVIFHGIFLESLRQSNKQFFSSFGSIRTGTRMSHDALSVRNYRCHVDSVARRSEDIQRYGISSGIDIKRRGVCHVRGRIGQALADADS